jgi:predicted esterase
VEPHAGGRVVHAGAPLASARAAMILAHGRNAGPENILDLLPLLDRPQFACLAPGAAGGTWYPLSFMAERSRNEPGISSGLHVLEGLVTELMQRGLPSQRIVLLGFSQGACLTAEFAARHPRRYGGVMVLTGGLIGPPGTRWGDVTGALDGTPVFLGCSDADPHVPESRVRETASVFARMGADVTTRIYPGMGHLVNDDEVAVARGRLARLAS